MNTLSDPTYESRSLFVTIPLTRGQHAIVDPEDADLAQLKWYLNGRRYAMRRPRIDGKKPGILMHRVILERKLGRPIREGLGVDHINGNGLDNRRENLREATQGQNMRNLRLRGDNASQYKGVRHLGPHSWEARVDEQTIGYFDTAKDASFAYDRAALEQYGEFSRLNHPLEDVLAWVPPVRQFGKKSASGYRGVQKLGINHWYAQIHANRQVIYLGTFDMPEEAARAYDKAAREAYGERARLNFPGEEP